MSTSCTLVRVLNKYHEPLESTYAHIEVPLDEAPETSFNANQLASLRSPPARGQKGSAMPRGHLRRVPPHSPHRNLGVSMLYLALSLSRVIMGCSRIVLLWFRV